MVGGGMRRGGDDGPLGVHSTNVFAALESLRRKKKSDKEHGSSKSGKGSSKNHAKEPEQPAAFWAPTPLPVKSWADVDDDDDYYATTAPPQPLWGSSKEKDAKESSFPVEVSESEEDGLDEGDDEVDDEHENEPEAPIQTEPVIKKPIEAPVVQKETERQLSKKELKKKELAELDAVLAELGISQGESTGQNEAHVVKQEKWSEEQNGDGEKKENATGESRIPKKKKKKDKSKEAKELNQPDDLEKKPDEAGGIEAAEEDTTVADVKERLKKVTSLKKKKSSKEMDAAARAAAIEAAARSAKLAAAKKKEKNHYNQQPVR